MRNVEVMFSKLNHVYTETVQERIFLKVIAYQSSDVKAM